MSQALAIKQISVEEYLAFEEKAKIRHEYMDGEIFSMAGATRKHSKIASTHSKISISTEQVNRHRPC